MATKALKASFNLHQAGVTAAARFGDEAEAIANDRGEAASGGKIFTDGNRNFTTDGITTDHKIRILEGSGNLIRDDSIGAVGTTTITLGGADFDASEKGLLYALYLPPDDADIAESLSLRGLGLAGFEEWLQKIEANDSIDLELKLIDLHHAEGLTQQVIVFDDTA